MAINAGSLSGNGTVNGNVNIGDNIGAIATLSPGFSPGQLNIGGDLTLGTDANSIFELAGTTPGTQYDFVNVTGAATLNGGLLASILNGFTPTSSDVFTILTASNGITGEFTNAVNNSQYATSQGTFTVAYTPNSVQLTSFQAATPVPFEPSPTLGLLALGAWGGVVQFKKYKRQNQKLNIS